MDTFTDQLVYAIKAKRSVLVVGLDPQFRFIPQHLLAYCRSHYGSTFEAIGRMFLDFNRSIIDATYEFAAAAKLQTAFYEKYGHWGVWAFEKTVDYARSKGLIVIEDGKRGDGGDTADAYADGHIGEVEFWSSTQDVMEVIRQPSPIRVDCLTVQPGIGTDCISHFVQRVKEHGTGIFVVTKSSFRPNSEIEQLETKSGLKVWQEIAHFVDKWGEGTEGECGYRNVGVVMGATYPTDAPEMRKILPNAWFLIPGYGGQGGTADEAVAGINPDGLGGGVNSSRGVIYAYRKGPYQSPPEQFAEAAAKAARASRDELNEALKRASKRVF